MADLSLNLSVSWENQDEFQRLLKNVAVTQKAFNEALRALDDFQPEMRVVSIKEKGKYKNYEQTYQEETATG